MSKEEIKQDFLKSYGCTTLNQFKFRYLSNDKFEELMNDYFFKCSCNRQLQQKEEQLIKYLEDKIKHLNTEMNDKKVKPYGREKEYLLQYLNVYKDILGRLKSGKYET